VIGAGRWGNNIIRTVSSLDGVSLGAVASRNPKTAGLVPTDCRVVAHWRELVAASDLDGIIIASPPETHLEILLAAIAAKMPVLVEKPLVCSREQAQSLRAALAGVPAIILVDHIHLFHPAFRALRREAAKLGPVRSIASSAGNRGPYRADVSVLWDWGPHDLAMCLALVPGPARATGARCLAHEMIDGATAERLELELTLRGDVGATVRLSTLDDRHRWFAAYFDRDTLVYRDNGASALVRFPSGADIHGDAGMPIPVTAEMPLSRAVQDFVQAVQSGSEDRESVELGLAVTDLLADFDDLLLGTQCSP